MEIELPDGTILEAPDGADVKKVVQGYRARTATPQKPYSPVDDMSAREKFGVGVYSGARNALSGAANLYGKLQDHTLSGQVERALLERIAGKKLPPDYRTPGWMSDAGRAEAAAMEKPNSDTGWGTVGNVTGEVAATAPLGVIGSGARALRGVGTGGRALMRTLAARLGGAGAEGAVQGAITASPDDLGQRVGESALTSAGVSALFGPGGRILRGLVKKSPEAELLETIANQHGVKMNLPLSQAANEKGISGMLKSFYGKILPLLPGTGSLKNQADDATSRFREVAMKEGSPETMAHLAGAGDDVHTTIGQIGDAFENSYKNTIKSYAFNTPAKTDVEGFIAQKIPNIDQTTLDQVAGDTAALLERYGNGGKVLDGDNLIRAKTTLARLGREAKDERTGQAYFEAQDMLDDLVRQELSQGGKAQNLKDLAEYEALSDPWKKFIRVQRAAARTAEQSGRFTAKELKGAVKATSTDRELAKGTAPLQDLAEVGERTVGTATRHPGPFERALAWGSLAGLGLFGSPLGAGLLWGGAKAASSKGAQNILMGNTKAQKFLVDSIRNYQSDALRRAVVAGNEQEQ